MKEGEVRLLWRGIRNTLYVSRKDSSLLTFEFLGSTEGGATVTIAAWDQDVKNVESICVLSEGDDGVQVIWHTHQNVYRDIVTAKGSHHSSVVLRVDFIISFMHVIWSSGILLLEEQGLCNLHIFDTSILKCRGYITLQADSQSLLPLKSPMRFDDNTRTLWCLVRRYDESTKLSSTHLNCYAIPEFSMVATLEMPRGFTNYALINLRKEPQGKKHLNGVATVLCSHQLLQTCQLLHFAGPKKPYRQENCCESNFTVHFEQDVTWDRDFQPQTFSVQHEPYNQVVPTEQNAAAWAPEPWKG